MSLLKPLEELEFNAVAHKYRWDGKWLHLSPPTQILSIGLDQAAKDRIAETKDGPDGWERRGNKLHSLLENHLLGAADLNPEEFGEWWEPLKSCWLFENCEVLGVELRLTDKKTMGGSCDFLIKLPTGELVLGDLKSVCQREGLQGTEASDRTTWGLFAHARPLLPEGHGRQGRDGCRRSWRYPCHPRRPS